MAAQLPRRPLTPPSEMVAARAAVAHWDTLVGAAALPRWDEPQQAFVASANNRPAAGEVAVGHFFSPDDRVRRLRRLLGTAEKKGLPDLARMQQDVTMERARYFAGRLAALLPEPQTELARALAAWDGAYAVDSAGALAFELLAGQLIVALHGREATAVYAATWDGWALLAEDLEKSEPQRLQEALAAALREAKPVFERLRTWGEAHRLQLSHFLGRAPVIGKRYRFANLPSAGGNETLMKAAHGFAFDRHVVRYGANARHLSDLADPDANHFVLLGGQDGWLGSTTWLDQLPLWREGRYVQMPLGAAAVAQQFTWVTVHRPRAA
jgi:penicillin amidase